MRSLACAGLLLVGGVVTAAAQTAGVPLSDAVPSITVEGRAQQEVRPDLAVVTLGATTDRPQAADAARENARTANAIVASARRAGIADADIQTSQLRLSALSDPRDASRTRAFRATNLITLRLRNLDRIGDVIGALVGQGANDVQDIAFEVADPEPVLSDLRARATAKARHDAELYAQAAGVALGRVLRIAPGDVAPVSSLRSYKMQLAVPAPAPPPVEAGAETLSAQVQVTWELRPLAANAP